MLRECGWWNSWARAPAVDVGLVDREGSAIGHDRVRGARRPRSRRRRRHGAPLEQGRASGRFDVAYESRRSGRVEGLTNVKGDTAHAIAYPGGDCLDVELVAAPDRLKQRDAGDCDPQAGTAQLLGGDPSRLFLLRYWSLPVPWLSTKPILQWTESKSRSAPNPYPAGTRTCVGNFGCPTEPE